MVALVVAALLLWWGFGKPGLYLRDRLCWIDDLSPGDGAVVQWREMDQPVRVAGRTSWLPLDVAMACSLPVIVSRTAGCAEDLLPGSEPVTGDVWRVTSYETADGGDAAATKEADARAARSYLELRSNGFVFDPRSIEALATALARVAESEDRRLEMGRTSWKIVAKFSCENFAKQALSAARAAQLA